MVKLDVQVSHYVPVEQPASVYQLTDRLFAAYHVEGGQVYLAGCEWEDRLFLHFCCQHNGNTEELWTDHHGQPVSDDLVEQLGLRKVQRVAIPPPYAPAMFRRALDQGCSLAEERFGRAAAEGSLDVAAVWCKFVQGKLRFTIGSASADLPFSGWARSLVPPPFLCPHTGRATFHLAATHDGRILDASAIGTCEVSGRRFPLDELIECSWTGKRAAKELIDFCSLTGQPVLRSELIPCSMCREKVSPAAVQDGLCSACRSLRAITKADPRMARLLAEYPPLDRWHHWELAETHSVYVIVASGLWKKLLLVVDKESLELRLLATRHRLQHHWRVIEPVQYPFVLRE